MKARIDAIRWAAGEIEKQAGVMLNSRSAFPGREAAEEMIQHAYSIELLCKQWDEANVGATENGKPAQRILYLIGKAGADGLSKFDLSRHATAIPIAIRNEVVSQLVADGAVTEAKIKTGRRPKTVYRLAERVENGT